MVARISWGAARRWLTPADILEKQLELAGINGYTLELRFHPTRRWRFDLAFIDNLLAVEIDGGAWPTRRGGPGRHTRGAGKTADCEKLAHAAALGWRVIPVTPQQVESGQALEWITAALAYTPH